MFIGILIKNADETVAKNILKREYKKTDLDQLRYSREFLEALKKNVLLENDNLMHYCHLFGLISRDLVSKNRLH